MSVSTGQGLLELDSHRGGYLRRADANFLPRKEDVRVPARIIQQYNLKEGHYLTGNVAPARPARRGPRRGGGGGHGSAAGGDLGSGERVIRWSYSREWRARHPRRPGRSRSGHRRGPRNPRAREPMPAPPDPRPSQPSARPGASAARRTMRRTALTAPGPHARSLSRGSPSRA